MTESEIFLAASQIENAQLRSAFLDSVCQAQPELRLRVETLLRRFAKWEDAVDKFSDELPQRLADIRQDQDCEVEQSNANPAHSLAVGQSLLHYRIERCLGIGGMGEVYLAIDTKLNRRVAVKLLPRHRTHDETWVRRFISEARAISALNHPNILTVHEVGVYQSHHYMVTEFIEGTTLRSCIESESLSLNRLTSIAISIAQALESAHASGIIHRDLKPDNVMIRRDGLVKVLDFGLAKSLSGEVPLSIDQSTLAAGAPATDPNIMLGTVRYMSPEQVRRQGLDYRSDVFALGIVLYEMFTGHRPFSGMTDADIMANILHAEPPIQELFTLPIDLQHLISKLLRKDRDKRLLTAREIVVELELILEQVRATSDTAGPQAASGGTLTQVARSDRTAEISADIPEVRYTRSGDVNIAYQAIGSGEIDIVFVMGWVSHLDWFWKEPNFARFLRRLSKIARLILFDKRGTGLSDRVPTDQLPTLEQRMDDLRAVMNAVGSDRAVLCGVSEGGPMCALFAATYPEKTTALIMIGSYARRLKADDYPWGPTPEQHAHFLEDIRQNWGGPVGIDARAPSLARDQDFRKWWATYLRMGASPGAVLALTKMNAQIDVRPILKTIQVPTLVLHRSGDRCLRVEEGRYLADNIPGARFISLSGDDHLPFVGKQEEILDPIEEFLTGVSHDSQIKRVLATVLSAEFKESGPKDACQIAVSHAVREVELFRGNICQKGSHELLATFDGPARAVRAATAMSSSAARLGVELQVAVHTGECEVDGDRLSGPAIESANWLRGQTPPGQILVSNTVKDLVAGADLHFQLVAENSADNDLPRMLYRVNHQPL